MDPQSGAIEITGADEIPKDTLARLKATVEKAVSFYRQSFGPADHPVRLDVRKSQAALRTGYNTQSDTICFPDLKNLKNAGLDSVDVINHEVFHALTYQSYPDTRSKDPEAVRLHEGLADYFAYQLNPDEHFGEDFETDKPYLRSYRNGLTVSLSSGPHEQGSALTSLLLKNNVQPEQIKQFLSTQPFTLEGLASVSPDLKRGLDLDGSFALQEIASNCPPSPLHRYRISDGHPLQLAFEPNSSLAATHPNLHQEWTTLSGIPSKLYTVTQENPGHFSVEKAPGAGPEKLVALFLDGETLLGSRPFYFGPPH